MTLRQRLAEPRVLLAPGVYDALTALVADLKALALGEGATLFMVLMAGFTWVIRSTSLGRAQRATERLDARPGGKRRPGRCALLHCKSPG